MCTVDEILAAQFDMPDDFVHEPVISRDEFLRRYEEALAAQAAAHAAIRAQIPVLMLEIHAPAMRKLFEIDDCDGPFEPFELVSAESVAKWNSLLRKDRTRLLGNLYYKLMARKWINVRIMDIQTLQGPSYWCYHISQSQEARKRNAMSKAYVCVTQLLQVLPDVISKMAAEGKRQMELYMEEYTSDDLTGIILALLKKRAPPSILENFVFKRNKENRRGMSILIVCKADMFGEEESDEQEEDCAEVVYICTNRKW